MLMSNVRQQRISTELDHALKRVRLLSCQYSAISSQSKMKAEC